MCGTEEHAATAMVEAMNNPIPCSAASRPLVSVIICTKDRAQSLRHTVESITRCDAPASMSVELIVVDNGSSDTTAEVLKTTGPTSFVLRYLHEPKPGKANACNTALAGAQGEVLLFTD